MAMRDAGWACKWGDGQGPVDAAPKGLDSVRKEGQQESEALRSPPAGREEKDDGKAYLPWCMVGKCGS